MPVGVVACSAAIGGKCDSHGCDHYHPHPPEDEAGELCTRWATCQDCRLLGITKPTKARCISTEGHKHQYAREA